MITLMAYTQSSDLYRRYHRSKHKYRAFDIHSLKVLIIIVFSLLQAWSYTSTKFVYVAKAMS
jgi:hypothetical protein